MRAWFVAIGMMFAVSAAADEIDPRAENILTHVVLHELGHAVVREFDLPILRNEEVMADAFATFWLQSRDPDLAAAAVSDAAAIWLHRSQDAEPDPWAEHLPPRCSRGFRRTIGIGRR